MSIEVEVDWRPRNKRLRAYWKEKLTGGVAARDSYNRGQLIPAALHDALRHDGAAFRARQLSIASRPSADAMEKWSHVYAF